MNHFSSKTQYDTLYNFLGKNRSLCSLFSIITVSRFLENNDVSEKTHQINLDCSVKNYVNQKINGYLSFSELLKFNSEYLDTDVQATSPELINNNIIGYEHIFKKKSPNPYAVIFLKNSKFFTLLCTPGEKYHIRDCHDIDQYNFTNELQLISYLNDRHQFNKNINIGGFDIAELSNIEFLVIENNFPLNLDLSINNKNGIELTSNTKTNNEIYKKLIFKEYNNDINKDNFVNFS